MVTRVTAAVAASLASGGTEKVGFLNDMVAHLWPHINVIGGNLTREIVEPMFEQMLPGPLKSMKFTKIDLGAVPVKFDNVDVHARGDDGSLKLDVDIIWDGHSDIELSSKLGTFGVRAIKLAGRLSVVMDPLINRLPLVSAVQVGFTNPPMLRLDFTGLAEIAEWSAIESTLYKIVDKILADICVLPNRIYVKLDPATCWYQAFQPDIGVLRLTVDRAMGFKAERKFLRKDIPDPYTKVRLGAQPKHKTEVVKNSVSPTWADESDWLLSDHDQDIFLSVYDSDTVSSDDALGVTQISVGDLLLKGSRATLPLVVDNVDTGAKIEIAARVFDFTPDLSSFTDDQFAGSAKLCGVMNVLIAGVRNLPVEREDAAAQIKVKAFKETHRTVIIAHNPEAPDLDAKNPCFDRAFRFALTQDDVADAPDVTLTLLNRKDKLGTVSIPFDSIKQAEDGMMTSEHQLGNGAVIMFRIIIRGLVEKAGEEA